MRIALASAAFLLAAIAPAALAEPLGHYGADAGAVTVSGISSGGFMAGQLQVAYSASIKGAGIVAAGPWWCAGGQGVPPASPLGLKAMMDRCMSASPRAADAGTLASVARAVAGTRSIDPVTNLEKARIFVFSGAKDAVVKPAAVAPTSDFFRALGVPDANLKVVTDVPAGHAMVTMDQGGACDVGKPPFIADCDYDLAGEMLSHLYGGTLAKPQGPARGTVVAFDQAEFGKGASLADTGYAYVPESCWAEGGCRVHVALHGCLQSAEDVKGAFYEQAGYNAWADANRIIVLYPQVGKGNALNPYQCWDWWGYTGPYFARKGAPQPAAIKAMVDRVTAARG